CNHYIIYLFTSNFGEENKNYNVESIFLCHQLWIKVKTKLMLNLCHQPNTDQEEISKLPFSKAKDNRKSSSNFPDFCNWSP
ncbi:hypothetical protein HID58_007346, partial [Brassica napus]